MDQIVKLDAEQDFAVLAQLVAQLPGHRAQILLFVQGLPEMLPQFRVDRLGVIVAEKTEARVDFFFQQVAVDPGEPGQHFDQKG